MDTIFAKFMINTKKNDLEFLIVMLNIKKFYLIKTIYLPIVLCYFTKELKLIRIKINIQACLKNTAI
jgi:hypothetical protein